MVLGDEGFVGQIQEVLEGDEQEQAGLRALRRRPGIEAICQVVEQVKGERWERFPGSPRGLGTGPGAVFRAEAWGAEAPGTGGTGGED